MEKVQVRESKFFENNPFFLIDVQRWGHKFAIREWMIAAGRVGKYDLCNPWMQMRCNDCDGFMWASVSRPAMCFKCWNAEVGSNYQPIKHWEA